MTPRGWVAWCATLACLCLAPGAPPEPPKPSLRVAEATNGEVKITATSGALQRTLHVEETGGAKVEALRVDARLVGPDGAAAELDCKIGGKPCNEGAEVPAFEAVELTLSSKAGLAALGAYAGTISLAYGKREIVSWQVTRTLAPAPVEITVPDAVEGEGGTAQIRIRLRELGGVARKVEARASLLQCKGEDGSQVQADGDHAATTSVDLGASEGKPATLSLADLPPAGECQAEVAVALPGAEPVRKTVKVLLHRCYGWGILWIAAGVLLSFGLRLCFAVWLPGRSLRRRTLIADRQLRANVASVSPLEPAEARVADAVGDEIRRVDREIAIALFHPPEDARVAVLDRKVELLLHWIRARRLWPALRDLTEKERQSIKDALDRAAKVLLGGDTPTADVEAGAAALAAARETIATALEQQVAGPIRALREDVEQQPAALELELGDVRAKLEAAEAARKDDDLVDARRLLDEARTKYVAVMAAAFFAGFPKDRPAGFLDDDAWRAFVAGVKGELDAIAHAEPEPAMKRFRTVQGEYFRKVVDGLGDWIKLLLLRPLPDALKEELGLVATKVQRAADALVAGDLRATAKLYGEALQQYDAAKEKLVEASMLGDDAGEQPPPAPAPPTAGSFGPIGAAPGAAFAPPELARFDRVTFLSELALLLPLFVVAMLSGMHTLHVTGPAWGTGADMLGAFLWGLGVHQIADAGIAGLRELFGK
jgi:hypothetical protein